MLDIRFFAALRERLNCEHLTLDFPGPCCVADIRAKLAQRDGEWQVLEQGNVLIAVNKTLCDEQHHVNDGDEIAFFPPVTGG